MFYNFNISKIGNKLLYIQSDFLHYFQVYYYKKLIYEMFLCMNNYNGVGLASSQIGILKKFFIYIFTNNLGICFNAVYFNPKYFYKSVVLYFDYEGCLSVINFTSIVNRSTNIVLYYLDLDSIFQVVYLSTMNARITQHEIDHLNGILFISRICSIRTIKYFF